LIIYVANIKLYVNYSGQKRYAFSTALLFVFLNYAIHKWCVYTYGRSYA